MKKVIILLLFLLLVSTLQAYDNALEVKTDVEGVKIYLEGKYQGETVHFDKNVNIWRKDDLEPGSYTLKCTNKNFDPNIQTVTIRAEGPTVVNIKFRQREIQTEQLTDYDKGEQVKQTGTIIIRSKPTGANVYLNDSKQSATCDVKLKEVTIGNKQVKIKFGSKSPLKTSFNLSAGDIVKVIADFFNNTIKTDVKYKFTINSKPKGKLYVDDKYIGLCPQTLEVNKGKLSYKIVKKGFKTYYGTEHVTMNDFVTIKLSGLGTIKINVNKKDAKVYVDGKYIDSGSISKSVKEGKHNIEIRKPGHIPENFSIPIEAKKITFVEANIIENYKPTKELYTITDLGDKRKTWEDYYDKSKEKMEKQKSYALCFFGILLSPASVPLAMIADLFRGFKPYKQDTHPDYANYLKEYPCITLAAFDPKGYILLKENYDNIKFNDEMKKDASKKANRENSENLDKINQDLIDHNKKIEKKNNQKEANRCVKYKIENGSFIDITPDINLQY